jgi:hypothetical protein
VVFGHVFESSRFGGYCVTIATLIFPGPDIIVNLEKNCGISKDTLPKFESSVEKVLGLANDANIDQYEKLNTKTISVIEGFMKVIQCLFQDGGSFQSDYKVLLHKANQGNTTNSTPKSQSKALSQASSKVYEYTMHFRCLNPGVGFTQLTKVLPRNAPELTLRSLIPLFLQVEH